MNGEKLNILPSLIVSISLIICAFILRDAYLDRGYPAPEIPYISADLSQLSNSLKLSNKDTLTLTDAADYLGIEEKVLSTMIHENKLEDFPYSVIDGKFIFSKKALDEWVYRTVDTNLIIER
jgi:hypothetical protein